MVTPELLQYITQSKTAGFSTAQIEAALRAAGWAEDAITEALYGATAVSATRSNPQTNISPSTQAAQPTDTELARIQDELEEAKKGFHTHTNPPEQQERGIMGFLIRKQVVQNEAQANLLMIAISLLSIGTSVWLMWPKSNSPTAIPPISPSAGAHTSTPYV